MFTDQTLVEVWFRIRHRRCTTGDEILARANVICASCSAVELAAPESGLNVGRLVGVVSRIDEFQTSLDHCRTVFGEFDTLALSLFKVPEERATEVRPLE